MNNRRFQPPIVPPIDPNLQSSDAVDRAWERHARISVLEQQIRDQKENTALALAAADKAIINALIVADKAVAKVELAAEKTYLESSIKALKEAFESQIEHQKELTAQALASADKAVAKAETAAEKRFESVNEFRSTLSDQQNQLATKSEVNLRFKALEDRVNTVVEDAREIKGHGTGASDNRAFTYSLVAMAISIILVVIAVYTNVLK